MLPWRMGLTIAVNAAAPTKKTSKPIKTHAMPLMRRLFLGASGALPVAAMSAPTNGWLVLPNPVPRRKPQFRQKRNSAGIADWQFEQVIIGLEDIGISELCDITRRISFFKAYGKDIRRVSIRQIIFGS